MDNQNLDSLSVKNRARVVDILEVLINELEIQQLNRLSGNRISWNYFKPHSSQVVISALEFLNNQYKNLYSILNIDKIWLKIQDEIIIKEIGNQSINNNWTEKEMKTEFDNSIGVVHAVLRENLMVSISYEQLERLKIILMEAQNQVPNISLPESTMEKDESNLPLTKSGNTYENNQFSWSIEPEINKGTLVIKNKGGSPMIFKSGSFGGLNELMINYGEVITREQLRKAIAKYKQGGKKEPNEINISKWKDELKTNHLRFFEYLDIKCIEQNYQLVWVGSS